MKRRFILAKSQCQEMLAHVDQQAPLEACGLLAGRNDRVEKVILVRNQAQSPVRFVMDPYEQLQAFDWIESHGLELIGIFHSHPAGPETASVTDIAEAAYQAVYVIWSHNQHDWQVRGFWIEDGGTTEIALQIVE
jgi:[CysO sulfur-carrier protein]-S-L-cysteine hydrolase